MVLRKQIVADIAIAQSIWTWAKSAQQKIDNHDSTLEDLTKGTDNLKQTVTEVTEDITKIKNTIDGIETGVTGIDVHREMLTNTEREMRAA